MNNLRLLKGCVGAILLSYGACMGYGQPRVVTLEDIFEVAEHNSRQLRPSLAAEVEAMREVEVASSNRLPAINADLSLSFIGDGFITRRNFSGYAVAPTPHFGNVLNLNVTQPVYTGGALTSGIRLAELKLTASRFATELCRDNIRFQLTGYYLDLYKFYNLRKVVESNISRARKVLEEMQVRYEQGTVLYNDITRYELLVSNLELQLTQINNTIEILNSNLVTTSGLPAETTVVPDSTILDRSLPVENETRWQNEARLNSSVISLAKSEVEISREAENLVKAERIPKIGLQAAWGVEGPILVEVPPINRNLSTWFVGVGVSYNLSSLYKSNKALAKSEASTRKSIERLELIKENIELTLKADYIRYLEAFDELKTREKSVELADRNYAIVFTRYNSEMALITDMLDAANSRLDAEQQLINARINIIYYYYKLLFTAGKI